MRSLLRTALVALVGALGVGVGSAPAATRQTAAAGLDRYPSEAWILEFENHKVRFEDNGTGREEWDGRVRIQSEAGVRQWGQLVEYYVAAFDRVEFKYVRVVKPDGTAQAVAPDKVMELTSPVATAFPIYSDQRQKHLAVPDLRPGDALEFGTVRNIHTPLAPGHFWFATSFQRTQIALDERLEIDVPRGRELHVRTADGLEPEVGEDGERRLYRFRHAQTSLEDVENARKLARRRRDAAPADVVVSSFRSWAELGAWYRGLERDRLVPTEEIRAKARELTRGLSTDAQKIAALYEYVATKVRYVAISFGQGAVQPHAARETLANGYGDCKDKHTLLAALLADSGIQAHAALISTTRNADADVPYLQFDHVVTAVRAGGERLIWLDTTMEVAPFGLLSPQLRGRRALLVPSDDAARLVETPTETPLPAESRLEVEARLDEAGKWSERRTETYRGDFEIAPRLGFRLAPRAQWKTNAERGLRHQSRGREVIPEAVEIDVSEPAATRDPFVVRINYSLPGMVELTGRPVLHLPTDAIGYLPPAEDLLVGENRRLFLNGPWTTHYRGRIELPSGWTAKPNVAVSVSEDFGEYTSSYSFEGRTLTIQRTLTIKSLTLAPERAGAYDQWRAKIAADRQDGFYLESVAVVSADANAAEAEKRYKAGIAHYERGEYPSAVASLQDAVELAANHNDAWARLGRAYQDQNQTELAISAFRKQIEIAPAHFEAHRDLGRALWTSQQLAEAQASFLKALEIKPEDAWTRWRLGALYLAQKKFEAALASLENAAARDPRNWRVQMDLATAHLGLAQDAQAFAAFDSAVMLSPTPLTWNNAAWQLCLAGKRLERAREWAESAVVATAAHLRSLVAEQVTESNLPLTRSLVSYWDTLGWVHFRRGDFESAEPYLRAADALMPNHEITEHYRQLRERRSTAPATTAVNVLDTKLQRPKGCTSNCRATALLVLASTGSVVAARLTRGDLALEPAIGGLLGARHDFRFPDTSPTQVIVPAALECPEKGGCRLVLGASAAAPTGPATTLNQP
jgi:tetratricopeptide (TPR) repeat protein/transglutaminase-like putative cysteine protease